MDKIIISAPLAGWAAPLSEVPDPVFSGQMLGDGVAIHPMGEMVHAPCDGVVLTLNATRHAVTLISPEGAEILVHIGLDTVGLGGRGFEALVGVGDKVQRGDPLIRLDLDGVAQKAKSMISPIIVTNPDAFSIAQRTVGQMVQVGDDLLYLTAKTAAQPITQQGTAPAASTSAQIGDADGIHARPAAQLADIARQFDSEIRIIFGSGRANVRSAIAVMALGLKEKDVVNIEAAGPDAEMALVALKSFLAGHAAVPANHDLTGIRAVSGLAVGKVAWLADVEVSVRQEGAGATAEAVALENALAALAAQLDKDSAATSAQQGIFLAHKSMLADPDLRADAKAQILAGQSAGVAWAAAIEKQSMLLRASGNERIMERAADLADIKWRVLRALNGQEASAQVFTEPTILCAQEILPSQLANMDVTNVAGIATIAGGPTSHAAIMAAALGLPMLVAVGDPLRACNDGEHVVLDASNGRITRHPTPDQLAEVARQNAQRSQFLAKAATSAHNICRTFDGVEIAISANIGTVAEAKAAFSQGADGVGLLRTEFLFLGKDKPPSEDEQWRAYQAIADAMAGRPIIMRLLDIGGDKPAPYLKTSHENNPALGVRGIRLLLARPDLLETQLRAILRVAPLGQCSIMVPMVSDAGELAAVRTLQTRLCCQMGIARPIKLGVMIETPAAAMMADALAKEADFLSIGTNDLTQYTLAMDRENAALASGIDGFHPAVLRMIASASSGGQQYCRDIGVCGGLAGEPLFMPLLIGLGVRGLSMPSGMIAEAKARVRQCDGAACKDLATQALALPDAAAVRALCDAFLKGSQHA